MRLHDGEHNAGQPRARPHVQHVNGIVPPPPQRRDDRQTIKQVLDQHLPRIADRGQIVRRVPALQLPQIVQQSLPLACISIQSQRYRSLFQELGKFRLPPPASSVGAYPPPFGGAFGSRRRPPRLIPS